MRAAHSALAAACLPTRGRGFNREEGPQASPRVGRLSTVRRSLRVRGGGPATPPVASEEKEGEESQSPEPRNAITVNHKRCDRCKVLQGSPLLSTPAALGEERAGGGDRECRKCCREHCRRATLESRRTLPPPRPGSQRCRLAVVAQSHEHGAVTNTGKHREHRDPPGL
ncbi:hypothetical protein NDU88_002649 [Pleurodeles waltl]|uniref:Uncharacterized protein n=1 Tax=Pleurodeles waltl TaxID=8319 RepID=A0AAV7UAG9_PLEWA|nr:hypothetical protein NDU88_002649 [Pleurodeles waltl]